MGDDGSWQRTEIETNGRPLATLSPAGVSYAHTDRLGTVRARTRADGSLAATCTSLPFGDGLTCTGPDASPLHLTGKPRDPETGLGDFGARYNDSTLGRFMTPDWSAQAEPVPYAKLDNPQSLNLYTYVLNNPVTRVDPDGHNTLRIPGWCGGEACSDAEPVRTLEPWLHSNHGKYYRFFPPCLCANPGSAASRLSARFKNSFRRWIASHPVLAGFLTRYMGRDEAATAGRTGQIPNYGRNGDPRPTHLTRDEPVNDAQAAQSKYELPETPTHRATVPDERAPNTRVPKYGPKTSGGGDQVITDDSIPVTPDEVVPLEPIIIDPLL